MFCNFNFGNINTKEPRQNSHNLKGNKKKTNSSYPKNNKIKHNDKEKNNTEEIILKNFFLKYLLIINKRIG